MTGFWTLPALDQGLTPHGAVIPERVQDVAVPDDGDTVVFTRSQPADPRKDSDAVVRCVPEGGRRSDA